MTEQKKTWHDVPMEELVLTAREYPAMQAAIGWNILKHAAACGFRTGAGLLRAIHAHGELLEALKALLFIADSHSIQETRQVCVCHALKPGFTCPYCKARAAIAKAEEEAE